MGQECKSEVNAPQPLNLLYQYRVGMIQHPRLRPQQRKLSGSSTMKDHWRKMKRITLCLSFGRVQVANKGGNEAVGGQAVVFHLPALSIRHSAAWESLPIYQTKQ
jgi:hypothetical protein